MSKITDLERKVSELEAARIAAEAEVARLTAQLPSCKYHYRCPYAAIVACSRKPTYPNDDIGPGMPAPSNSGCRDNRHRAEHEPMYEPETIWEHTHDIEEATDE